MKKIYLLAVMTAVGTMSFAQSSNQLSKKVKTSGVSKTQGYTVSEKAPGVVLFNDTFDDPTNWVIDGDGQQGVWEIGTNADPAVINDYTFFGPMASTTAGDGFAYFDVVDFLVDGNIDPQNAWIEMANPVDMTGYNTVIFSFEQRYIAFNTDFTYVEMSLDNGATWIDAVDANADVDGNGPPLQNKVSLEFTVNEATQVKFRFRWENSSDDDQAGGGYAWLVDDVNITSIPDNDMATSKLYHGTDGLTYYQTPEAQIAPIEMSINVENVGLNDQEGVQLSASETVNGVFSDVSPAAAVAVDMTDSLVLSSTYTPTGLGNYALEFELLNDSIDDDTENNQIADYNFEVTEHIYARDKGTIENSVSGSFFITNPVLEPGNLFTVYADADLTAVDVTFGNTQTDGVEVFGRIYGIDGSGQIEANPIAETAFYTTSGDGGNNVTLVFASPVSLSANTDYVVSVGAFTPELIVSTSGRSATGTSLLYGDLGGGLGWYVEPNTPMIRMNFEPGLSVENNEMSNLKVSKNFPNPFSNETTVVYSLENASDVNYTLVDLTGKTILEVNEGNVMAGTHEITIDGAALANGVYYFNMTANGVQTTHKMIVNK